METIQAKSGMRLKNRSKSRWASLSNGSMRSRSLLSKERLDIFEVSVRQQGQYQGKHIRNVETKRSAHTSQASARESYRQNLAITPIESNVLSVAEGAVDP